MINCKIDGCETKALWDTGSQISLISQQWIDNHDGTVEVLKLSKLLGRELDVQGVGGFKIPYEGYVLLKFEISSFEVEVPFWSQTKS